MSLASTHHELSERLENGRRIWTHVQHMRAIASYKSGSLRRDPGVLSATGAADWPLGVDGICDVRIAPRIAGKSPLLHMGHGKDFVRFALVGANNVSGVSKGNVTTFTNAWNNADLRYTYGGHRLQEDFLLRAKHPRSFGFILREHTGFDPVTMTVGDIRILDPVLEPPAGSDKLAVPLTWLVTQQGGYWTLTVTLPEGDWTGWTVDPTLSLQPDGTDGIDTYISGYIGNVNKNYGTLTGMAAGEGTNDTNFVARALIKFSTSLPAGAIISSTTLSLYCYAELSSNARALQVYRQKRAWVEGTRAAADDTPATGATWGRYDTTNNWQTAGGFGANDCEQTSIGSRNFSATETLNEFKTWALTGATWADLDLGNGWMIKADTELNDYYAFYTSDYAVDTALRPKLDITYTLPGGGSIFGSSIFHSAIHGQTLTR